MTVTIVAAIARNGVIGADNDIPWRLPGEQRLLKEVTYGHVLVMGRRTYDSIGRPLPGRTTIVVTRQPGWEPPGGLPDGLLLAGSVEGALKRAARVDEQVFVLGGGQVYDEALAMADRLRVTWVDAEPPGDTLFPEVDWSQWRQVSREQHDGWVVCTYDRHDDGPG